MKSQPDIEIEQAASSSKRSCHAETISQKRFPLFGARLSRLHATSAAQQQHARHVCQLDAAGTCLRGLRGVHYDHRKTDRSDSAVTE